MPAPPPSAPSAHSLEEPPVSPSHAVCVYAEPLVVGRRVVVVGEADSGLGQRLLALGARSVKLYDIPLPAGAAGAFDARDGAFDVAIVPDLGLLGLVASDRENLLLRLRRVLGRQGVAIIGARASSPNPLDYYELYDAVAREFACVRMIAEVPFRGVALADLGIGEETPDVSVETQLAGDADPPDCFFALAGQEDVRLAEYAIIQLPASATSSGETRATREEGPSSELDAARQAALAEAQLRASLLEAQVDELRTKVARQVETTGQARRATELEARLAETRDLLKDAEGRAADQVARATALEGALADAEAALIAVRQDLARVEARLHEREAVLRAALTELEGLRSTAASAGEAELVRYAAVEARAAALDLEVARAAEDHAVELAELERALQERARVVLELEQEVTRREGLVRELLGSLDEARSGASGLAAGEPADGGATARDLELARLDLLAQRGELESREASLRAASERAAALAITNAELRNKIDGLSMEVARRESDKQEIVWRVGELEQQLARLEAEQTELTVTLPPPPMSRPREDIRIDVPTQERDVEAERLAELEEEIDVLKQAMAQEHEARLRAESGDELVKARSELARQAVLLEQLSRELEARDRARSSESQGRATGEA